MAFADSGLGGSSLESKLAPSLAYTKPALSGQPSVRHARLDTDVIEEERH